MKPLFIPVFLFINVLGYSNNPIDSAWYYAKKSDVYYNVSEFGSSRRAVRTAAELFLKMEDTLNYFTHYCAIANLYIYEENYTAAKEILDSAFMRFNQFHLPQQHIIKHFINNPNAIISLKENRPYESLKYLLEDEIIIRNNNHNMVGLIFHQQLGNLYQKTGDYENSIIAFSKGLIDSNSTLSYIDLYYAILHFDIANSFMRSGKFNKANQHYHIGFSMYTDGINSDAFYFHDKLEIAYLELAEIFLQEQKLDSVGIYLDFVTSNYVDNIIPQSIYSKLKNLQAELALKNGNSSAFHEIINQLFSRPLSNSNLSDRVKTHLLNWAGQKESFSYAKIYYDSIYLKLDYTINSESSFSPPTFIDKSLAIEFFELFFTMDSLEQEKYLWGFDQVKHLSNQINRDINSQASQLMFRKKMYSLTDHVLAQSFPHDMSEALFELTELNKASSFAEALYSSEGANLAEIPDALKKEEKELKGEITYFKKKMLEAENDSIHQELSNLLLDKNIAYDRLVKKLEQEYPRYFQLKYDDYSPDISEVQARLEHDQAMVSYFYGQDKIYQFVLSKSNFGLQSIELDSIHQLEQDLNKIIAYINSPPGQAQGLSHAEYQFIAQRFQEKVLQEGLNKYAPNSHQLIIIPDGQLSFLPFEALIYKSSNNTPKYLIDKYEMQYAYSATLWIREQEVRPDFEHHALAFAPSFADILAADQRSCVESELYSLKCSEQEVRNIESIQGGLALFGAAASKAQFTELAPQSKIVHLATHACADEDNWENNRIYFTDDYVSNLDLQTMNLRNELVVLSACNTGTGAFAEGEGILNLAKGFLQAGVRAVLMSLWSVDDCATSDIMVAFHKNLKNKQDKSTALRNAKLQYMNEADKAHRHPYYWAAFVVFGNTSAVTNKNLYWRYLILAGGILLGLLGYRIYQKQAA